MLATLPQAEWARILIYIGLALAVVILVLWGLIWQENHPGEDFMD